MGTRTGNPPWENEPSTASPIDAAALQAMEDVLDQSVATTLADAKGDLLVATGPDTFARLPVGANGQGLIADSAQAAGVRWAAAAASGLPFQRIPAIGNTATSSFFKSNQTGHLQERATAPMPLLFAQTITIDQVAFQLSTLAANPGQTGRIVLKELVGDAWTAGTALVTNIPLASPQTTGEKAFSITPVVLNAGTIYGLTLYEDQAADGTIRVIQGYMTGPAIGGNSGYGAGYDLPVGSNAAIVSGVTMIRVRRSA